MQLSPNSNRLDSSRSAKKRMVMTLLLCGLLAACQPSPEERIARAEAFGAEGDYRSATLELKNVIRSRPDSAEERVLLANASYQIADFAVAETEYRKALELGLDRPDVWIGLGRSLLAYGNAREAFEVVIPNLSEDGASESALVLLADIYSSMGNATEADRLYKQVLVANPTSAEALVGLSVIAAKAGDTTTAEAYLEQAISANADSDLAWRAKANYLQFRQDFTGAAEAYATAIDHESVQTPLADRFMTRVNRVSALVNARKLDDADAQFAAMTGEFKGYPLMDFLRGRLAFERGNYDVAQEALRKYVAAVPSDARAKAVLGATNFSQDQLYQAEMYLIQAVRANVGGENTRRLLAETQLRLDKPEEALAALKSAEESGQSDAVLLSMLGRAEIGVGNTDEAIRYFERGLTVDPANSALNMALAASYMQAGRTDDAIALLESMPKSAATHLKRETLLLGAYIRQGDRDKAIAESEKLIAEQPKDAEVYAIAGVLRQTLGDLSEAKTYFLKALDIDTTSLAALYSLGKLAIDQQDFSEAELRLTALLDAHPSFVPGLALYAGVLQAADRLVEVRPRLQAAIEKAPKSSAAHVLLIRLELQQKNYAAAAAAIENARKLFPDDAGFDNLEGQLLLQQGNAERGYALVRKAAESDTTNPRFQLDLAVASLAQGELDTAVKAARNYRGMRPSDLRGLSVLVQSEIRADHALRARPDVDQFITQYPNEKGAIILLADVELSAGNPQKAAELYGAATEHTWNKALAMQLARARQAARTGDAADSLERWLAENPAAADVRFLLAQIKETNGDNDAAVAEYERLVADGTANAIALNNLAWRYSLDGRPEAIDLAEKAHKLAPEDGNITDTLGWIHFMAGDTQQAIELLRLAVEQVPDSAEVRYHLGRALLQSGDAEGKVMIREILNSGKVFASRQEAEALAKTWN